MTEERISKLEDIITEFSKLKSGENKDWKKTKQNKQNRISKGCEIARQDTICIMEIPKEREKGIEDVFEIIMTENFPKLVSPNHGSKNPR